MDKTELFFWKSKQTPRVVLIPGGTGQIGSEIVKMFLEQGARVIIPSRSGKYSSIKNRFYKKYSNSILLGKCDYYDDKAAEVFIKFAEKKFGNVDIFVYSAGMWSGHQLLHKVNADTIEEVFNSEIKGFWNFIRLIMPRMITQKHGKIVVMGTYSLLTPGKPYLGLHRISKIVLEEAIKTLSNEQGFNGINVNMIAPSIVLTKTEQKIYSGINKKYFVPIEIVTECVKILCYTKVGDFLYGQTISLNSPWKRYIRFLEKDLNQRGLKI